MATRPIKLATVLSVAHLPATIAAKKVTLAESATPLRKRRHATVVVRPVTSHANVPNPPAAVGAGAWVEDTVEEEEEEEEEVEVVKSATNVAR